MMLKTFDEKMEQAHYSFIHAWYLTDRDRAAIS